MKKKDKGINELQSGRLIAYDTCEDKLRIASITLFIRAFLGELEGRDRSKASVVSIGKCCRKYVAKHFKKDSPEAYLLADIANGAYDDACNLSEMKDIHVTALVVSLFDSKYRDMLEKEVNINPKHIQSLYNSARDNIGLKARISNDEIAKWCIQCINKRIYDHYTKELI